MKCKIAIIGLLVLIATASASALDVQDKNFGLGFMAGEPTGFSLKYWFDKQYAVDGALGWSFYEDDAFQIHSDFLYQDYALNNSEQWPAYYGVGALLMFKDNDDRQHPEDDDTVFGLRFPFGMTYLFEDDTPFDFFLEIAPVLELAPELDIAVNASIGLRFYF